MSSRVRATATPARTPKRAPLRTLPARRPGTSKATARAVPSAIPGLAPAAPVIKWVGGKSRLLPELRARMPGSFNRYFEPFMGGAALFFRTAPGRAVLSDWNRDLVTMYRALAGDLEAVIRRLELHRRYHDETHYYETRARWNSPTVSWSDVERAATFIYLNKTCFNGLWRVNRAGNFNVPMGRYVDPPICAPEQLRAAAALLRGAELRCGDYRDAVRDAGAGDFVYFDPPYDPITPTANFTSYTENDFGQAQQRELAELARGLVSRGAQVMLSNHDTPFIRSLFPDFQVDQVMCGRAVNSNASRRGDVAEVVITGGYSR